MINIVKEPMPLGGEYYMKVRVVEDGTGTQILQMRTDHRGVTHEFILSYFLRDGGELFREGTE